MKKYIPFLVFGLVCLFNTVAGQTVSSLIDQCNRLYHAIQATPFTLPTSFQNQAPSSGIAAIQELRKIIPGIPNRIQKLSVSQKTGDTLVVGPGNDSLVVVGNWYYQGTILVLGSGRLIFDNATATIRGNVTVWGDKAQLISRNSHLSIPQSYFYQRSLIGAGGSRIIIQNTTLDYGGLPHSLSLSDSATAEFHNVTNIGFTTCGLAGKATFQMDTCNEAGEFILQDSVHVDFRNARTILLWHLVDAGEMLHVTFPKGDSINQYAMNRTSSGVSGLLYDVSLDNCTNVLWGLMPRKGSDVKITGSSLRSIGVWFTGADSVSVSGLVNNSTYSTFTAPLNDRSLILENSTVQTWSIYTFENVVVDVEGCILGELGAFGKSNVTCTNVMVDGSGGYLFSSENAFVLFGFSSATCNVRSEKNGILVIAYSALTNGSATAIGSSILIVVQSGLIDDPLPLEGAVAWLAQLALPASASAGTKLQVKGSAWIDKAPNSALFNFRKYVLSYQAAGDTDWVKIADTVFTEVHNDVLGEWNTAGLPSGNYTVRLTLISDTQDQFAVDAMKTINLLPQTSNDPVAPSTVEVTIYPNPSSGQVTVNGMEGNAILCDVSGNSCWHGMISHNGTLDVSHLTKGLYLLRIQSAVFKFVKE